jgi:hypothetical protein
MPYDDIVSTLFTTVSIFQSELASTQQPSGLLESLYSALLALLEEVRMKSWTSQGTSILSRHLHIQFMGLGSDPETQLDPN